MAHNRHFRWPSSRSLSFLALTMTLATALEMARVPAQAAETPAKPAETSAKPAETQTDALSVKAARRAAALAAAWARFPVPPKIRRYAERLLRQYDTNGDGVLQPEEFAKMQGDPHAGDINRDGVISVDDLAVYVARYGLSHRIHLVVPTQTGAALLAGMSPTVNGLPVDEVADDAVSLEAALAAEAETPEDGSSEEGESGTPGLELRSPWARDAALAKLAGNNKKLRRLSPWTQKFHVSYQNLPAGLPDWFRARDFDGDGQITLHEFAPEATRKDIEEFLRYDVDRNGIITPAEALRFGGRSSAAAASAKTPAALANPAATGKRRP
jgi:hypothetical protein